MRVILGLFLGATLGATAAFAQGATAEKAAVLQYLASTGTPDEVVATLSPKFDKPGTPLARPELRKLLSRCDEPELFPTAEADPKKSGVVASWICSGHPFGGVFTFTDGKLTGVTLYKGGVVMVATPPARKAN